MNGRRLDSYQTVEEITARLAELYAKAERVVRYNATVYAGAPNLALLDEKQQRTLAALGRVGSPYPFLRSIGHAIDFLQSREVSA